MYLRFAPGPSARPALAGSDNVPTVPAVTSFERFRPSEATDIENNFRFNPSPRPQPQPQFQQPQPGQPPVFAEDPRSSGIVPRFPLEQSQQFPNSQRQFPIPSQTSQRTPTFTIPPAISIEPISGTGVISRPGQASLVAAESETTGSAFRGRQRVRVRPDLVSQASSYLPFAHDLTFRILAITTILKEDNFFLILVLNADKMHIPG